MPFGATASSGIREAKQARAGEDVMIGKSALAAAAAIIAASQFFSAPPARPGLQIIRIIRSL